MKYIIEALFPFFASSKANRKLKKRIVEYKHGKIKYYSRNRCREKNYYFDCLDKKYKETFETKIRLEEKAKTNVIGITIAITLITGASNIITTINSKFPFWFIQWISFAILLVSVVYLIIAGILAIKILCNENEMFFISVDATYKKDLNSALEYDECTAKNICRNIIRNNLIFSSYACIKNALICMVAILILCTIPLHMDVKDKNDRISLNDNYQFVYLSDVLVKEEDIDYSNVENLIIKDISNREKILNEICFVSSDNRLVIKYSVDDTKVTVLMIDRISAN